MERKVTRFLAVVLAVGLIGTLGCNTSPKKETPVVKEKAAPQATPAEKAAPAKEEVAPEKTKGE